MENIKSPCNDKCKYNEDNICVSCYRTKHEIVFWSDFTNEEKQQIIERLNKKKKC